MYCPLIDRFSGALIGGALAEQMMPAADGDGARFRLTPQLIQAGQKISSLAFCTAELREGDSDDSTSQTIAEVVLTALMLHDSCVERLQAIQHGQATLGIGVGVLSEAIALCLNGQLVTPKTLQLATAKLKGCDPRPLLATLEGLIAQKVPLQVATQAIAAFPEISALDRAIALSLYCWLCTPQQFHISVGRSYQALQYLANPNAILIPAITGMIGGVSVGFDRIPLALKSSSPSLTGVLIPTANQLFQIWAGLNQAHPNPSHFQQSVVAQPGRLKSRTSDHDTLY